MTRVELVVAVCILVVLVALLFPAVLAARERARLHGCTNNLRRIGTSIRQYLEVHESLPPAAVWRPGSLQTLMLNEVKQIDLITYENWALLLLPYLGQAHLGEQFDFQFSVMSPQNAGPRMTPVAEFSCPADDYTRVDNLYAFGTAPGGRPLAQSARGNYALNGGTHNPRFTPESAATPHGDRLTLEIDPTRRQFRMAGSGIAGINRAFRISEFTNGQSTLAAIDEIRAGIHPFDPRGVWAVGQIGGSITWAHGVAGDAGGPNNAWALADDLLGCARLRTAVGSETLTRENMPCASYVDRNDQATARSRHASGVNVLFLDGAVRFVHDRVDRGVWHVMHSRETPADVLVDCAAALGPAVVPPDAVRDATALNLAERPAGSTFKNSLDMEFVTLPAGDFTMGMADRNVGPEPPDCPAHRVRLTRPYNLGRHEVTHRQFQSVTGRNPSDQSPQTTGTEQADDFPAVRITWYDAVEFCTKLSQLPEEQAAKRRYRLPTEAEWEYACREGQSASYEWQAERRPNDRSGENAGVDPPLPVTSVGSYPANSLGLYDMRGNVWEWCSDWFDRGYYSRSPLKNPAGPATGFLKVVRGADWVFVGELCHINYPTMPPWKSSPYVGFRVVCEEID